MYSRKLYVAVAAVIDLQSVLLCDGDTMRREIARDLATLFANDNPNFDRARFLAACGVEN